MPNRVFIATSLDGYIADKHGGLNWLQLDNPEGIDMGFHDFMARTDALVMGRNTFETVLGFEGPWPYSKPLFVLSNSMERIPEGYEDKAELVQGEIPDILERLHASGYRQLYIDGGKTIQSFLALDLIDELTITTIPILLGGGTRLFGTLDRSLTFRCVETECFLDQVVQSRFIRKR